MYKTLSAQARQFGHLSGGVVQSLICLSLVFLLPLLPWIRACKVSGILWLMAIGNRKIVYVLRLRCPPWPNGSFNRLISFWFFGEGLQFRSFLREYIWVRLWPFRFAPAGRATVRVDPSADTDRLLNRSRLIRRRSLTSLLKRSCLRVLITGLPGARCQPAWFTLYHQHNNL